MYLLFLDESGQLSERGFFAALLTVGSRTDAAFGSTWDLHAARITASGIKSSASRTFASRSGMRSVVDTRMPVDPDKIRRAAAAA